MNKELFYKQLLQEEKDLVATLEAVRLLKKRYEADSKPQTSIPFNEPAHDFTAMSDGYDQEWVQKEKVLYALKHITKGTAEDVAKTLLSLDNEFDESKAFNIATIKLSRLYRDGIIGATKVGKKYRYFVKPSNNVYN
ncbi:hypothetical protein [Psychroserpens sp. SPM9]|uniref:hypothetical protein n=1 Tax=Psychroserpens sp. SPM9 TaxID=2975598 RepID=UPI0021A6C761|nr:hypothetical protein [Psychroserpens sp. SPM9]MDG5490540.1 hypothetical protein [Psychroserpens sp. SPM9]